MFLRLLPVLSAILLAACTSSEPQNALHAPLAESSAASPPSLMQSNQTGKAFPDGETGISALQQGSNCRTVGEATLCDAPHVSAADDRLYTN